MAYKSWKCLKSCYSYFDSAQLWKRLQHEAFSSPTLPFYNLLPLAHAPHLCFYDSTALSLKQAPSNPLYFSSSSLSPSNASFWNTVLHIPLSHSKSFQCFLLSKNEALPCHLKHSIIWLPLISPFYISCLLYISSHKLMYSLLHLNHLSFFIPIRSFSSLEEPYPSPIFFTHLNSSCCSTSREQNKLTPK